MRFVREVRVIGRDTSHVRFCGVFTFTVPAAEANRMCQRGQARRIDKRAIRLNSSLFYLRLDAPKPITLRSYQGQSMTTRESLGVVCGCMVDNRSDAGCRECNGAGVIEIDGHCSAFRYISRRDRKLFRLSVTENLSKRAA